MFPWLASALVLVMVFLFCSLRLPLPGLWAGLVYLSFARGVGLFWLDVCLPGVWGLVCY